LQKLLCGGDRVSGGMLWVSRAGFSWKKSVPKSIGKTPSEFMISRCFSGCRFISFDEPAIEIQNP
jgi:hypothetical protein